MSRRSTSNRSRKVAIRASCRNLWIDYTKLLRPSDELSNKKQTPPQMMGFGSSLRREHKSSRLLKVNSASLEVHSKRSLTSPITCILRRLGPGQRTKRRAIDGRHRWCEVGVVEHIGKGRLETGMSPFRDMELLCHAKAHGSSSGPL